MQVDEEDLGVCVYCNSRWVAHSIPILHTEDCPMRTGLYPVRLEDLEPHGMACPTCGDIFELGDFYVHVPLPPPDPNPHVDCECDWFVISCLGCGAQA